MADNVDAVERTVNGATAVLPRSTTRVPELGDPAAALSDSDGDSRPGNSAATDGREQADAEDPAPERAEAKDDADDGDDSSASLARGASIGIRFALVVGLLTILALAGLAGWFGYGAYQDHQADKVRNLFLAVGKQGALNLTTINYTEADADIQRILDSSTGQFYDDFSKRAPAFVDVVKQAQAKTDGSIVAAGLESVNGDSARVLVALLVTTSNKGVADQQPRHWRMRIDVQKVGDTVKVANVGFVP